MPSRNFPPSDAPRGTPPKFEPQAWAVRYIAPARPVTAWNHDEWRRYGTRHHAEAGIKGMRHFAPRERVTPLGTRGILWMPTPMIVELWEYISLKNGSWYLHETRVYRDGEVFVA